MRDSLIKDRIVLGVNSNATRKKLLQVRGLTLNQCLDMCRSNEATNSQMKTISGSDAVHKIGEGKKQGRKPPRNGKNDWNASKKPPVKSRKKCLFCGESHPLKKDKCPAWGQKCSGCGGRNHFKRVCKKSKSRKVHGISDIPEKPSSEESDIEFLAGVALESKESDVHAVGLAKEIYAEMLIDSKKVNFQIDCGASIIIITGKTRTRSRNQGDHENIANVEWIASEAYWVGTNHLTQSKNKKEVLCGVYRRRGRSNTPNRSEGSARNGTDYRQ